MDYLPIVIGIILVIVAYFVIMTFMKNKTPKKVSQSNINIEELVKALGGKENIVSSSHSPSKISVVLKDYSITDIDSIKALGASGIVEGKDSLSLIFGRSSEAIDNDLTIYLK